MNANTTPAKLAKRWAEAKAGGTGYKLVAQYIQREWSGLARELDELVLEANSFPTPPPSIEETPLSPIMESLRAELGWARDTHAPFPTCEHGMFAIQQSVEGLKIEVWNGAGDSARARKLCLEAATLLLRYAQDLIEEKSRAILEKKGGGK